MTRLLRSLILIAAVTASAAPASADAFYDTYQRALATFKAKNYTAARADFLLAYDLRAEPIILFNVAQTYRLEHNPEQALVYYKRFLAESKIADNLRTEAQRHVTALEAELAARAKAEARPAPKEPERTPVREAAPPRPAGPPRPPTAGSSSAGPPGTVHPRSDEPGFWDRVPLGSKIGVGVGAVGLGSAIVLGVVGLRAEHRLQTDPTASQADADRVAHYQTAINVSWAVTGVAFAAAVTLYLVAPARDRKAIAVAPTGDGGWAAAVTGRF